MISINKEVFKVFNKLTGQADTLTEFAILKPSLRGRNLSLYFSITACLAPSPEN